VRVRPGRTLTKEDERAVAATPPIDPDSDVSTPARRIPVDRIQLRVVVGASSGASAAAMAAKISQLARPERLLPSASKPISPKGEGHT